MFPKELFAYNINWTFGLHSSNNQLLLPLLLVVPGLNPLLVLLELVQDHRYCDQLSGGNGLHLRNQVSCPVQPQVEELLGTAPTSAL